MEGDRDVRDLSRWMVWGDGDRVVWTVGWRRGRWFLPGLLESVSC